MVTVRYRGQRGNQLFQYCLGRILAEKRGYALRAASIDGFDATRQVVDGRKVLLPWRKLRGHKIDFQAALDAPGHRRWKLDGYFLNYAYYGAHAERIREWFAPAVGGRCESWEQHTPGPEDLLVMVRLRDFVTCGAALAWSYFKTVLEEARYQRLFITSDELDHEFLRQFAPYQPTFVDAGPLDTLKLAARFKRLAISNSTFGWWAAFLGQQDEVWYPIPDHVAEGAWALNRLADGVDLRIDDPRFRYVYGVPTLAEPGAPAQRLVPLADSPRAAHAAFHQRSQAYCMVGDGV
jgi:hypothetical protein